MLTSLLVSLVVSQSCQQSNCGFFVPNGTPAQTCSSYFVGPGSCRVTYGCYCDAVCEVYGDCCPGIAVCRRPKVFSVAPQTMDTTGALLTISGLDFGATQGSVQVGSEVCVVSSWAATQITCTAPSGVGTAALTVTTSLGVSNAVPLSYRNPRITAVSPSTLPTTGGTVTLTGTDFGPSTAPVTLSGTLLANVTAHDHTSLTLSVAPGVGPDRTLSVSVGGLISNQVRLSYAAPVLSSASPATLPALGGTLALVGSGFGDASAPLPTVTVGGAACTPVSRTSDGQLSCAAPAGFGTAPVVVTIAGQVSNARVVTYPGPSLTSVTPTLLPTSGGSSLDLVGTSLDAPGLTVSIGAAPCPLTTVASTLLRCTAPAGTGRDVPVRLTWQGSTLSSTVNVSYLPPVIVSVAPTALPTAGGASLVITGHDFGTSGATVTVVAPAVMGSPYIQYMNSAGVGGWVGGVNANSSMAGYAKTTQVSLYVPTATFYGSSSATDYIQGATISGVDAVTGLALTQAVQLNTTIGGNTFNVFDATKFANGQLIVRTTYADLAGNTYVQSTPISMTSNGGMPTGHIANSNQIVPLAVFNGSTLTYNQVNLISWFPSATTVANTSTSVAVAGITDSSGVTAASASSTAPFTAIMNATGGLAIAGKATGAGYGSVDLVVTDVNGNKIATDFQVAVVANYQSATGTTTTDAVTAGVVAGVTVNATNTLYDASAANISETFNINALNTNSVMNGGMMNDTFQLNFATMGFAQITGGAGNDTIQLTGNYKNLDLSQFNHAGQQVIKQVEIIDMARDTGANTLTLTAADLVLVQTANQLLTVNGGTNDTVNMLNGGFVQSGATNSFDAFGGPVVNGGYSKYTATYVDTAGSHLVEVLLQNGVAVL